VDIAPAAGAKVDGSDKPLFSAVGSAVDKYVCHGYVTKQD